MKRFTIFCFITLMILCVTAKAIAQDRTTMPWDHVDLGRGQTPVTVYSIVQDATGFLWFSTGQELNRFDGYSLTTYEHNPKDAESVCDGLLYSLAATPDGSVWVGSREGAMCRFDAGNERFIHYGLPVPEKEQTEDISLEQIMVDRTQVVWVATSAGGIYRFNENTRSFTRYQLNTKPEPLQDATVLQAFEADDNSFWLSIRGFGLALVERGNSGLQDEYFRYKKLVPIRLASDAWIVEGAMGELIVGTRVGQLFSLDHGSSVLIPLLAGSNSTMPSDITVTSMIADKQGKVWLGTRNNGVLTYDPVSGAIEHFRHDPADTGSLDSNTVRYIYQDRSETIWVGTDRGLNAQNRYRYKFHATFTSVPSNQGQEEDQVIALHFDGSQRLWISTLQNGVGLYDRSFSRMIPLSISGNPDLNQFTAFSILATESGQTFFGSANDGLLAYETTTGRLTPITSRQHITDLLHDHNGSVWFATREDGLGRYDIQGDSVLYWTFWDATPQAQVQYPPTALLEDKRGNIWIGTDGAGLHRLSPDRKNYKHFRNDPAKNDSLCDDRITCLYEDARGAIWIGTRAGLSRFSPDTSTFTSYYGHQILPDDYICGIAPGSADSLWLSTTKGLVRFLPASGTSVLFDAHNGVSGYPFTPGAISVSESGEVFVGGRGGFCRFQPKELIYNPYQPNVVITAFHNLNKRVSFEMPLSDVGEISLKHDENFFSFEFAALDFADPVSNRYRYMLEGVDSDWIDSGVRRFANYTKIPPGSYTFRVQGSNNDGVMSASYAEVAIVIEPPFWATWQFRLLSALLVLALAVVSYKARTNAIKRQRDRLQVEVDERREAEKKLRANQVRLRSLTSQLTLAEEKERRRISQQLHDRIGHALLMTKVGIMAHAKGDETADARHPFGDIIETVNSAMQDARSLSVEISPPSLHKFGFETAAESLIERVGEQYGLTTIVSWSEQSPISDDVAIILYQALRELLVNIIKHAEAESIQVAIENDGKEFVLSVQDDGCGFDIVSMEDEGSDFKGYGLFSIHERLESIGGSMSVQSEKHEGTNITLRAPLKRLEEDEIT